MALSVARRAGNRCRSSLLKYLSPSLTAPVLSSKDRHQDAPSWLSESTSRNFIRGSLNPSSSQSRQLVAFELSSSVRFQQRFASTLAGSGVDLPTEALKGVTDAVSAAGNEVAAVVAQSSFPINHLQQLIDFVHVQSGLPWWLTIVGTTVAIRVVLLPVVMHQMRATSRLALIRPTMTELSNKVKASNYDPDAVSTYQRQLNDLFKKSGTNIYSPFIGALVQAPLFISFFFAIQGMATGMPSFQEGGALWFKDLSTADATYAMPLLSSLTFLATIELGAADGMQNQPSGGNMKTIMRLMAVAMVPLTATFPKAVFCYWLTANVFSLAQGSVFRLKSVRNFIGLPEPAALAAAAAAMEKLDKAGASVAGPTLSQQIELAQKLVAQKPVGSSKAANKSRQAKNVGKGGSRS